MRVRKIEEEQEVGRENIHREAMERDNFQREQYLAEIRRLEGKIKTDNEEFVKEIKKYNAILYQMQGDIDKLEHELTIADLKLTEVEN